MNKLLDNFRTKELVELIYTLDSEARGITIENHDGHRWFSVNVDSETVILDSENNLALPIDRITIRVNSEGKLVATGVEAGIAIELTDSENTGVKKVNVLYDSETGLGVDSENRLFVKVDSETIVIDSTGRLTLPLDFKTLVIDSEKKIAANIDGITIILNSEGKLAATGVEAGVAVELVDSEGTGVKTIHVLYDSEKGLGVDSENRLFVKFDSETILADKNGVLYIPFDSETIIINSEGKICVPIDNETIRVNSEGLLEADSLPKPVLPETFLHVNSEGKAEWRASKINGVELVDDKNTEEIKVTWFGTDSEYQKIVNDSEIYDYTIYIVEDDKDTPIRGDYSYLELEDKPSINGMILTGDKLPSDLDLYTIPEIDNMFAAMRTIIVQAALPADPLPNTLYYIGTNSPYSVYLIDSQRQSHYLGSSDVLGYTGAKGIAISSSRVITHTNEMTPAVIGDETHLPKLAVDAQGHITSATTTFEAFPPLTEGDEFQYWRSKGDGTGVWEDAATEVNELSTDEVLVTPKAVFNYIKMLDGAPTWVQNKATMALGSYNRVGKTLTFTLFLTLTSTIAAGTSNANLGAMAFDTNVVSSCAVYGTTRSTAQGTDNSVITGWFDGGNLYITTASTLAAGTSIIISGTGIANN